MTIAIEAYEGYVSGDPLGSAPGMLGAVLGGIAGAALVTGIGLTGGLAVLGTAALGGLLAWVGEKIGDWISENWSSFAGVQQIADAWDTLSQRIGDFVESFTSSLNELWDNPTEWLDDLLNLFNPPPIDPLVIDLDGDGIELTALNRSSAFFDLDGDGFRERTGWVSPDDGLLALDRNGDGRIEGINELFGSATTSGYEVLRALDSNRDGRITAQDAQFSSLRIWRDFDGDGVSDAGELASLAQTGITSISLAASTANLRINGNDVVRTAQVSFADGRTTTSGDVLFDMSQAETVFAKPAGFQYDADVFSLPSLRGFGEVADLWVSMSMDGSLKTDAEDLIAAARAGNHSTFKSGFADFLAEWASVEDVVWAQDAPRLTAAFAFRVSDWDTYTQNELNGVPHNPPPLVRGYVIYDDREHVSERDLDAWLASNGYVVPAFTSYALLNTGSGIPLESTIRGPDFSAAGPTLVMRRGASIDPSDGEDPAPAMEASKFAFLQRIMGQDFSAGVNFVSSENLIVSNPTPTQTSQLLSAYEDVESYMMARFLAQAAWSVIAREGETADLGYLAPFRHVFVNPLTDDIVGNRKALVVDLINLYRSVGQSDQAAVETLSFLKRDLPELAALVLASFPEIGAASVLSAFDLSGLVQGTAGADNLSANTSAIILGGLGNDTIVATEGSQFILGGSGADILQGGVGSDTYLFSAGDGNDVITDYDLQHGNDRLIFTDLASTDVTLSRSGEDLRLTFTNGETITIKAYLSDTLRNAIESIEFADGTTWTHAQARQRLVSDMKATGVVVGTEHDDTYYHASGDGSYSITDYDWFRGNDRLIFTDLASTDVTLSRSCEDLRLTFTNGETITIKTYLGDTLRYAIESIEFADGVTWTHAQARHRLMTDMKATGAVVGTEQDEIYYHTSGDGSYSVTDYDRFQGNDHFVFSDARSTDVLVQRRQSDPNDVVFTLASGDRITLLDQLVANNRYGVERIFFSDGVEWTRSNLLSAPIVDDNLIYG